MRRFHYSMGTAALKDVVMARVPHFAPKLAWFVQKGYVPHLYQMAFHTNCYENPSRVGQLLRFRMLVAGRRGGKTLSAAWEITYYLIHPAQFHKDAHGKDNCDDPLHIWVLVPNFKSSGRAAMRELASCFKKSGLVRDVDYKWNKGENYIEFPDGCFLEFKTAEQAEHLVGAGIDLLWMDEAAVITERTAYDYASPALDDRAGIVIGTSTPRGKNWWYKEFWGPAAHQDPNVGTVEYRTRDNPYMSADIINYRKATYHPLLFKQEYEAAFDSMAGRVLQGAWLKYYTVDELPRRNAELPIVSETGKLIVSNLALKMYIGVDPATGEGADKFAVTVLGVPEDLSRAYMLYQYAEKISFPDQIDLLKELYHEWAPDYIGIESNAYQIILAQQVQRLPGMPPVVPVFAKGEKKRRILSMSPMFKIGKVVIREEFRSFIDEWLMYDPDLSKPEDDALDSCEIALGAAGILLPGMPDEAPDHGPADLSELAARIRKDMERSTETYAGVDPVLGADF